MTYKLPLLPYPQLDCLPAFNVPGYTAEQMQAYALAAIKAQGVPDAVISGALFDFAGFLTTLDEPVTFGSKVEASPMVDLIQEFARKRSLSLDSADVGNWDAMLASSPPAPQAKPQPLSDEQILAIGRELGAKCRLGGNPRIDFDYARAIEAAHGIKE